MIIKPIPNRIVRGLLTPLKLENTDAVAFHHMAHPTWDVGDVQTYHIMKNGWMAIGYNYWIGFDGTVYEGRGLNVGAGIAGHNSHVISVGLQGDFMTQYPTDEQYKSAYELTEYLKEKIPGIKNIGKHSDYNPTQCPGKNFDINKILNFKEETKMEENEKKIYNWTTACPKWAQSYVHKALELGIIKGDDKGNLNLNDDKIWILTVIIRTIELMKGEK